MTTALIPVEKFNLTQFTADTPLPDSWDSALAFLKENQVTIDTAAAVLPEEFPEVQKKDLVNKKLVLLNWTISAPGEGDFGGQYIVCRGVTAEGKRFRFADGGSGIFKQLVLLTGQRVKDGYVTPNAGLIVEKGLTASEYTYTDEKGKKTPATTYYLANE